MTLTSGVLRNGPGLDQPSPTQGPLLPHSPPQAPPTLACAPLSVVQHFNSLCLQEVLPAPEFNVASYAGPF